MRKKSLTVALVFLTALLAPLVAQDQGVKKRNTYTKTFPIERIYSCRFGYMVEYRNSTYDLMQLYIAMKQFSGTNGRAVLVYGRGPEYPYLSVTWIDGQVDQVRIYAVDRLGAVYVLHGTDDELKARFPDDIEIKF